mmetsp:Transcript_33820/g.76543  ORF Transcript_33820/g.76543 Transcript_33820/m.76543 type:complete len:227 (-) Transcript_33820:1340-2020(-)
MIVSMVAACSLANSTDFDPDTATVPGGLLGSGTMSTQSSSMRLWSSTFFRSRTAELTPAALSNSGFPSTKSLTIEELPPVMRSKRRSVTERRKPWPFSSRSALASKRSPSFPACSPSARSSSGLLLTSAPAWTLRSSCLWSAWPYMTSSAPPYLSAFSCMRRVGFVEMSFGLRSPRRAPLPADPSKSRVSSPDLSRLRPPKISSSASEGFTALEPDTAPISRLLMS